ncbi:hypothetical protein Ade02nite_94760 [Paractinoplanes deccanensis]|uniref:Ricin B lectin domain-containing protein n=1 Tax=Paractinoplanes deccanensis TaxID=113561 RepID=A0ABQ3YM16_9ACTN|nr:RICIN domain-containing protein [Actinoplanes deccanensis]GID80835.1 hypothetical protein Ade02nite_94760 [Actinoplanes deccanensis]
MTDTPDREDPVLVRPYVATKADTAEFAAVGETETWPEPGADDTAVQPVVDEPAPQEKPPPKKSEHPVLRLAIFCGGVALALGVAAFLVFGPGTEPELPQPGAALPAMPAKPPIPESSVAASASAAARSASASASASASPSVSGSAAFPSVSVGVAQPGQKPLVPGSPAAPGLSAAPPAATVTATATTAAPTDRTGAITAASGRCLALGGLFGWDGSPVQVAGCNGGDAQTFTLATDGTLHVGEKCAAATGGTVRVSSCDGAPSWRTGAGGSLIASNGQCLTDPGRSGANVKVADCTGAAEQKWTLP